MLKLQNGWIWTVQRCRRSWRSSMRPETPWTNQGAKENGVSAPLNSSQTRGKAATKPSSKLQNLDQRSRCKQIHHAPGVEGRSGDEALQDRQEFRANHVAMRVQKCREILQKMTYGTLPNLVFTDEKKFDIQQVVNQQNDWVWASSSSTEGRIVTRRQNPQSVMILTPVTETGKSPLLFMPSGVKLNFQSYIADILEGCLLPWAKKHFQGFCWFL